MSLMDERFAPLLLDDAMYEVNAHGYNSTFTSQKEGGGVPYLSIGPHVMLDSRHGFNTPMPVSPLTPQTETRWKTLGGKLGSGNISGNGSYAEFFCAPLVVDIGNDVDDPKLAFVHDPNVFIRYFNGRYAVFFSTCTPIGPRFWSRFFAQQSTAARKYGSWVSAAVPLDVRHQIVVYQWIIHNMAAMAIQSFKRGLGYRILHRRAQRRRLIKLALLRASSMMTTDAMLVWRLKATPETIWAKVLAYI